MKRFTRLCALVLLLMLVTSCQSGTVPVGELDGLFVPIMERHDRYVSQDDTLTESDKATYLRSTAIMRDIITEASTQ